MPRSLKTFLAILAAAMVAVFPARAQDQCGMADIQALFCPGLKDEALYDKYGFDSYKMLVPGLDGWIFRSESDFRTDFSIPTETLDDLQELSDGFRSRGTELVMLITPTRAMMHSQYITGEDKEKYGLKNIDKVWDNYWRAINSIRSRGINIVGVERPGSEMPFFYRKDHHWNPYGAQQAAKALGAYIKKMPAYQDVEKVEYETHEAGPFDFYGVSKKVFKRICDTRQPPERIIKKITERSASADDQNELFGEANQPEIVLMGTSNSTMEPSQANFEGFLNEELSADILNMSVSGGGLDTAMISYLNSDQFRTKPAKIAIWEIPGYYDLSNHKKFFREAIPATYGSCEQNPVAIAKNRLVEDKTMIALEKLVNRDISGSDYYLNVNFSKPLSSPIGLDLRYAGNRDKYKFSRSGRAAPDGHFYVELQNGKKENLEKVVLNLPDEAKGQKVDVMLCRKSKPDSLFGFLNKRDVSGEPKHAPAVGAEGENKEAKL